MSSSKKAIKPFLGIEDEISEMNIGVCKKAITVFICRKLLKSENCVEMISGKVCALVGLHCVHVV